MKTTIKQFCITSAVVGALCGCLPEHTTEHHDAVVIGSGYGGAVAALRLGEVGIETVVLEKGRRWDVTDPSQDNGTFASLTSVLKLFSADSRSTWLSNVCFGNLFLMQAPFTLFCGKNTGVLEHATETPNGYDLSPKLATHNTEILLGVGVGGGSLVNNGITYRPLRAGWELAYADNALPYMENVWQDLEREFFAKAETMLAPSVVPDDILASDYYENVRIHRDTMAAAGYPLTNGHDGHETHGTDLLPQIVDWNAVREEIAGLRTPSVIEGEVWWGTNSGAKKSLDKSDSYLGQAEATGNVTIKPLHTVKSIRYDEAMHLYIIEVSRTSLGYQVLEDITVTTPNLIVAAGSVGTTKLMMAAKYQGGLPRLNEHVGTRWSNNGNTATVRVVSDRRIHQGGLAGTKSTDFSDPNAPLVIENLSQRVPEFVRLKPQDADVVGAVTTIAVGIPSQHGNFSWNADQHRVELHWPQDASKNIYDRFFSILTELDTYGAHRPLPIEEAQQMTLHPLGGMPLGQATDAYCQVQGYSFLYAVDGSILPEPSALANPSLLITALAERCMNKIVGDILARTDPWR